MSSDGYPQAVALLEAAQKVLTIAHRRQIPLPDVEIGFSKGEPSLEVKWFPGIHRYPAHPLTSDVAKAFFPSGTGAEWDVIGNAFSYINDVDGVDVEFTIYR